MESRKRLGCEDVTGGAIVLNVAEISENYVLEKDAVGVKGGG